MLELCDVLKLSKKLRQITAIIFLENNKIF